MRAHRFEGFIAGVGTTEGTRLVVGHWPRSPLGGFTDVMVERADGHRLLLAPDPAVARFVTETYGFDEVVLTPVTCTVVGTRWEIAAEPLRLAFTTGGRTPLGALLHTLPQRLATTPAFCRLTDVPARAVGLRTAGTAGHGRREFYGAHDVHAITSATASWAGADLGGLAPVRPAVRFGFGSTPERPSLTAVTTTVVTP